MPNFIGGRKAPVFFLFVVAILLRFLDFHPLITHSGFIYQWLAPENGWRVFNGVLSSLHLIEFYFLLRLRWWVILCLNPVSINLVNGNGDAFWIFESILLTFFLGKRFPKLAILTGLFTLALVFS